MLSICIPTYNRAELLDRCLSNIRRNIVDNGEASRPEIEICISDNGSTDHTSEVIEKYRNAFKNIVSVRHDTNLGFAKNFKSVLELASREWAIVIGDDDLVTDRFMESITSATETDKPLVVFSSEFGEMKRAPSNELNFKTPFSSPSQVLQRIGMFQLTFIGNLLFRMDSVRHHLADLTVQSAYPQTVLAWKLIESGGMELFNAPIVVADYEHRPWTKCQPLYTSLDMARVMTTGPFQDPTIHWTIAATCYLKLVKSLPRAIVGIRTGVIPQSKDDNLFHNLTIQNLTSAYSKSPVIAILACSMSTCLKVIPIFLLKKLLPNSE